MCHYPEVCRAACTPQGRSAVISSCFSLKGRLKGEHLICVRYSTSHNVLWSQLNNILSVPNITPSWQCPVKRIKILSSGCVNISIKDKSPSARGSWVRVIDFFMSGIFSCVWHKVHMHDGIDMHGRVMNVKHANTKPCFAIGKQQFKNAQYSLQWIYNYMAPSWLWLSKQM